MQSKQSEFKNYNNRKHFCSRLQMPSIFKIEISFCKHWKSRNTMENTSFLWIQNHEIKEPKSLVSTSKLWKSVFQISDVHPCCFYKSQGIFKKTEQQENKMKDTISLCSDIHAFTLKWITLHIWIQNMKTMWKHNMFQVSMTFILLLKDHK